jgi:hypothetical protein
VTTPAPAASLRDRIAAAAEAAVTAWDADVPGTEGRHLHEVIADAVLPLVAEARATEAYPPVHRWHVEHLDGAEWVHASGTKTNRAEAVAQLRAGETSRPLWADGTPVQRRLIRETTRYVVDDCPACDAGIEHTEHCPTPETHNWGCGCPGDQAPRQAAADLAEDVANEFFAAYDTEQGNGAMAVAARLRARADTTHPGGQS